MWNIDFKCEWEYMKPLGETTLLIQLPKLNYTDMQGCIQIAKIVHPTVEQIIVRTGETEEIVYLKKEGIWKSYELRTN